MNIYTSRTTDGPRTSYTRTWNLRQIKMERIATKQIVSKEQKPHFLQITLLKSLLICTLRKKIHLPKLQAQKLRSDFTKRIASPAAFLPRVPILDRVSSMRKKLDQDHLLQDIWLCCNIPKPKFHAVYIL